MEERADVMPENIGLKVHIWRILIDEESLERQGWIVFSMERDEPQEETEDLSDREIVNLRCPHNNKYYVYTRKRRDKNTADSLLTGEIEFLRKKGYVYFGDFVPASDIEEKSLQLASENLLRKFVYCGKNKFLVLTKGEVPNPPGIRRTPCAPPAYASDESNSTNTAAKGCASDGSNPTNAAAQISIMVTEVLDPLKPEIPFDSTTAFVLSEGSVIPALIDQIEKSPEEYIALRERIQKNGFFLFNTETASAAIDPQSSPKLPDTLTIKNGIELLVARIWNPTKHTVETYLKWPPGTKMEAGKDEQSKLNDIFQKADAMSLNWTRENGFKFHRSMPLNPETRVKLSAELAIIEAKQGSFFLHPDFRRNRIEIYTPQSSKEPPNKVSAGLVHSSHPAPQPQSIGLKPELTLVVDPLRRIPVAEPRRPARRK